MKITRIETTPIRLPMSVKKPWRYGVQTEACSVILQVHTDEGIVGFGEIDAAPHESGEGVRGIIEAIEDSLWPVLEGEDPLNRGRVLQKMDEALAFHLPIKAGIDVAVHDIVGKYLDIPIYTLLGGKLRDEFPTLIGVYSAEPDAMAEYATKLVVEEGYRIVQFKLGVPGDTADKEIARICAVHDAVGDKAVLVGDANGGWDLPKARKIINAIQDRADSSPQLYIEQPVAPGDIDGLAFLSSSSRVPIVGDESVFIPANFTRLIRTRAVSFVKIKPNRVGGIAATMRMVKTAEQVGIKCQICGTVVTGILNALQGQISAAIPESAFHFATTTGHVRLPRIVKEGGITIENGLVKLPDGPGLGIVSLDREALKSFAI